MIMKKSFFIIFLILFFSYLMINSFFQIYLTNSFVSFSSLYSFNMEASLALDNECLCFFCMVSLVTSLVVLYGEFYMDGYNNKKFFLLTSLFLGSMIILSFCGSYIFMILGWDGLGLSSLFLIMFYPGKIPLINSFMTFFYNRLGDCVMIFSLCYILNNSSLIITFFQEQDIFIVLIMLTFCSFTKSAQFPLSSWLPAAMSAPTPISAMVHSSTLVTAGIFIMYKFFFFLDNLGLLSMITYFSCLTFLVGGFLGFLELDFKKIVAFSTMSQISMIIIFLTLGTLMVSLSHMLFHSLFKTLLFCSCGISFIWVFSDQLSKIFYKIKSSYSFVFMLFISIFCMSGLPFSSSFFSKDLFLEYCLSEKKSFLFFSVILGSIFTLLYSSKILSLFSSSFFLSVTSFSDKKKTFKFLLFFSILTIFMPFLSMFFLSYLFFPVVVIQDLIFILTSLLMSMYFYFFINNKLSFMSLDLFFSKYIMFGNLGKISLLDYFSVYFNDHFIFKPSLFLSKNKNLESKFSSVMLFIMFFLIYFLWF